MLDLELLQHFQLENLTANTDAEELFKKCKEINSASGMNIFSELFRANQVKKLEEILTSLNSSQISTVLMQQDHRGRSTLHHIAAVGRIELLSLIGDSIKATDWRIVNHKGRTPLHIAAKYAHHAMTLAIIERAGRDNLFDLDGEQNTPARLLFKHLKYTTAETDFETIDVLTELINAHNSHVTSEVSRLKYQTSELHSESQYFSDAEYLTRHLVHNKNLIPGYIIYLRDQEKLRSYVYDCLYHDNQCKVLLFYAKPEIGKERELKIVFNMTFNDYHFDYHIHDFLSQPNWVDAIISTLYTYFKRFGEGSLSLSLYGFGVGGLIAQQFSVKLLEKINREKNSDIGDITLVTVHAPRVNDEFYKNYETKKIQITSNLQWKTFHQVSTEDHYSCWGDHFIIGKQNTYFFLESISALSNSAKRQLHFHKPFASKTTNRYKKSPNLPVLSKIHDQSSRSASVLLNVKKSEVDNHHQVIKEFPVFPLETMESLFAHGEYLFHYLAYKHLKNEEVVPVLEPSQSTQNYKILRLIHMDGLYVYLLRPIDASAPQTWKIVFQGTDFSEKSSAMRDLEPGSAGYKSLVHKRVVLLYRLNRELSLVEGKEIHITIGGHSLGGADSQNFFTFLLLAIAKKTNGEISEFPSNLVQRLHLHRALSKELPAAGCSHLCLIKKVDLMAYNAAGVRYATRWLSEALLYYLKQRQLGIRIFFQHVIGDIVQMVGEAAVAVTVAPQHAQVTVRAVEDPDLIHTHTNFQFWKKVKITPAETFNNEQHTKKVEEILDFKIQPDKARHVSRALTNLINGPGGCRK